MSHFQWNGNVYPMPQGWNGLSVEDCFTSWSACAIA